MSVVWSFLLPLKGTSDGSLPVELPEGKNHTLQQHFHEPVQVTQLPQGELSPSQNRFVVIYPASWLRGFYLLSGVVEYLFSCSASNLLPLP